MAQVNFGENDFYIWVDKGGVGKTSTALGIRYKMLETFSKRYLVVTNQQRTLLKGNLKEGVDLFIIHPKNDLPQIDGDKIIDLEGHSKDKFVLDVIKNCNTAIVPTTADFPEIQLCLYSIMEIQRFNPKAKIAVLANRIKNDDEFSFVQKQIKKLGEFTTLRMNESRAFHRMYVEKKSIHELMQDKLLGRHFKKIDILFTEICKYLLKH